MQTAALAQNSSGSEIFSGFAIILLLIAFIPTLIAGFAPGRAFQAFIVFLLNIGSLWTDLLHRPGRWSFGW
jgi:hypothetical protein